MFRFLFNRYCLALFIKFHYTKTFRIVHIITKYCSTRILFRSFYRSAKALFKAMSMKNIITQHHSNGITANKFFSNDKCLCKAVRAWLYRIA